MAESATPEGAPEQIPTAPNISATATAYQAAMQQESATPTSAASPTALPSNMTTRDIEMSDRTPDRVPARFLLPLYTNFNN
jgi:hypothetical protein